MRNRSIRFAAFALVFSTLGLGWHTASASAVYLPHRMLPSFVPATANSGVASFTPHYRFRPLRARQGPVGYTATRMPPPARPMPGYRLPGNFRVQPANRMAYRPAGQHWANGFRFRPLRPLRGAPFVNARGRGVAMPPQFSQQPRRPMHHDIRRFSSAYPAPRRGTLPGRPAMRYAAMPRPVSAGRYRPAWQPLSPDYRVNGYRFRPVAEPRRRIADMPRMNTWPNAGFSGVRAMRYRPIAAAIRPVPMLRGPGLMQPNRMRFNATLQSQPWLGYRFRPDGRFAAVGRPIAPPVFAARWSAYRTPGFEPGSGTSLNDPAVWRPLDDRQTRLARQPTAAGEFGQSMSDSWRQLQWPVQADQL